MILTASLAMAQATVQISNENTKVVVKGTSSVHDWECVSEKANFSAEVEVADNALQNLTALSFNVEAESLKSGKGSMDKNVYSALKTKKNKEIVFHMTSLEGIQGNEVTVNGQLTIAGATKDVVLKATADVSGEEVTFKGEYTLNMTQYEVEPPTAMFGAITTGEEVTIVYEFTAK